MVALPLSTTHKTPPGYKNLGIVTGIEIRSSNFIQNILAGFADFFGTEAGKDWTGMKKLLVETRDTAVDDMKEQALAKGATEIIGIDIDTADITRGEGQGMLVVTATGTAIRPENVAGGSHARARRPRTRKRRAHFSRRR